MVVRLYRLWAMNLVPLTLIACTNPGTPVAKAGAGAPLGTDLGASGPVAAAAAGAGQVRGTGILNAVHPAAHMVRLTHDPIAEMSWPAMTMGFVVARSVDLSSEPCGSAGAVSR
jgi:hypothetical protein